VEGLKCPEIDRPEGIFKIEEGPSQCCIVFGPPKFKDEFVESQLLYIN
jgi:hypothetical protein